MVAPEAQCDRNQYIGQEINNSLIASIQHVKKMQLKDSVETMKKVKKIEKSTVAFSLRRKAIVNGFIDGFTLPFSFFFPRRMNIPNAYDASPEKAWLDVGNTMRSVMHKEMELHEGKKPKPCIGKRRVVA